MYGEFTRLDKDGSFCEKFLDDLGLIAYADEIFSTVEYELLNAYGEDHLALVGNTYHEVTVFSNHKFCIAGLTNLKKNAGVVRAWSLLIKTARVTVLHEHDGILGRLVKFDWTFEIDIGNANTPLCIQVWVEIRDKAVSEVTRYRNGGENFEREWLMFLLRYV